MISGLYSVVLTLRRELARHGIDLGWIAAGKTIARRAHEGGTPEDFSFGTLLATETDEELAKARALIDHISDAKPDVVIFHVLGGPLETNVARYLPPSIRRIVVTHSITRGTYLAARAIRDWVHAAVGVSPRAAADLVSEHDFDPAWTQSIPNGVDVDAFEHGRSKRTMSPHLRVLSVGRIEHAAKGVLWMPGIVKRAVRSGAGLTLTVAGDGPDLGRLKESVSRAGLYSRVRFLGTVPRAAVPGLMAEHDVLLFPSVYEGFGITLVEAMAAGCVPVASLIRGVTDTIVTDRETGLLFPVGGRTAAARCLVRLARERGTLAALSRAALTAARNFSVERQGEAYFKLLRQVVDHPRPIAPPLPVSEWRLPSELQAGYRRFIPASVKHTLRLLEGRLPGVTARFIPSRFA